MKRFVPIVAGIAMVAAIVFVGVRLYSNPQQSSLFPRKTPLECNPDNPYVYSIDSLAKVDTALIGYSQIAALPLSVTGKPTALASRQNGGVYVAAGSSIFALDSAGKTTATIDAGGPVLCLATAPDGRLFAGSVQTIRVYDSAFGTLGTWTIGGEKSFITSIAAGDENIFVADAGMRVVWRLDTNGTVLAKIGLRDTTRGIPGFVVPSLYMDVAIGRDGSLWVVNPGRHLIENYRPNGDRLSSWGSSGANIEGFCGCCGPIQMAMLEDGSFVTAEKGIVRVKVYDQAGRFATVVAPHEAFNPKETNLDLAVDKHGNILVLDSHEKQVRIFRKK